MSGCPCGAGILNYVLKITIGVTKLITITDTINEDKPVFFAEFFANISKAIHADLVMNPDKHVHARQATAAESLKVWVEECLETRPRNKPLAWCVASMVSIAMVHGYDWLAGVIAEELQEAGIDIEPMLEVYEALTQTTDPRETVH
jgi:hypothetical protein